MLAHLRANRQTRKQSISTTKRCALVAQISQGGLRDAQSLLDQLSLLETSHHSRSGLGFDRGRPRAANLPGAGAGALSLTTVQPYLTRPEKLMDRGREPLIVAAKICPGFTEIC